MANNGWSMGRKLFLILALSIPFIFWGIGSIDLLDPDEGMYGAITREMAEGGDWLTPHFNGVRYLEKPPLYFWLTAVTTAIFGPSEWVVRLWTAIPALGTAILTWRLGELLYGGHAGLLSAIVMLSGVGVFRYVRVPATDFLLVFSITLAIYGFVKGMLFNPSTAGNSERTIDAQRGSIVDQKSLVLFYLGAGLAVLSKGLVGLFFPLLIVGLLLLLLKKEGQLSTINHQWGGVGRYISSLWSPFGLLLFFAISLPWLVLASWKNPGFFDFYIVDVQFLRFFNNRGFIEDDIPLTTLAFLVMIFIWFFPWSPFLPAAIRQGFASLTPASRNKERLRLLVGLWAITVIGFFSLSSFKLDHYFLPAITPLSLMVGAVWAEAFGSSKSPLILKWCLGVAAVASSFVGIGLLLFSNHLTPEGLLKGLAELDGYYRILLKQDGAFPFASVSPFILLLKWLGVILVVGFPLSFLLFFFQFPKASFATLVAIAGAINLLVFDLYLVVQPHHSAKSVAHALLSVAEPHDKVVYEGSLEYSGGLPFYMGRNVYVLNGRQGDLEFGSRYEEAAHLFLDNAQFDRLWEGDQRVFLVTRFGENESVVKDLSQTTAFLVGRYDSHWLYTNKSIGNGYRQNSN